MTDKEFDAMQFRKNQRCEVRKEEASIITRSDLSYKGRITGVDFTKRFIRVFSDEGRLRNVRAERVKLIDS